VRVIREQMKTCDEGSEFVPSHALFTAFSGNRHENYLLPFRFFYWFLLKRFLFDAPFLVLLVRREIIRSVVDIAPGKQGYHLPFRYSPWYVFKGRLGDERGLFICDCFLAEQPRRRGAAEAIHEWSILRRARSHTEQAAGRVSVRGGLLHLRG